MVLGLPAVFRLRFSRSRVRFSILITLWKPYPYLWCHGTILIPFRVLGQITMMIYHSRHALSPQHLRLHMWCSSKHINHWHWHASTLLPGDTLFFPAVTFTHMYPINVLPIFYNKWANIYLRRCMITDQRKWNCGKTKYIAWKISATVRDGTWNNHAHFCGKWNLVSTSE